MPRLHPTGHSHVPSVPPTPWTLGNINDLSSPKAHGNSWKRCLDPILREDKLKCQAWNDEVQTLLIFAGLFSAVVTAFVIQSYQDIQQIPANQAIAILLVSYAAQANQSSSSDSLLSLASTLATKGSYSNSQRVNIAWFLSLILSLTTVLIGIIALQWIREYQRYSDSSSAKRKLAIRNMRTDGLEKWKVPAIIAGLPLLLQTAVILFFIGLIDFLVNISLVIATPAIVVITLTLLFIGMTIILPACQCFWIVNSTIPNDQISQCPYKSPQAWTFLHILSRPLFRWHIISIVLFPPGMIIALLLPFGLLLAKVLRIQTTSLDAFARFLWSSARNMGKPQLSNWDAFDGIYLKKRQQVVSKAEHAEPQFTAITPSTGPLFDYDASMSIAHLLNEHIYDKSLARAAYDCFRELPSSIITNDFLTPKDISRLCTTNERASRISELLPPMSGRTKTVLRQHENEILFLDHLFHPLETNSLPSLHCRQLDLFVQTLGHIFTDKTYHALDGSHTAATLSNALRRTHLQGLLVPSTLTNIKTIQMIPEDTARAMKSQLLTIFETFVRQAINSQGRNVSVFCERGDLLGDYVVLIHTVTVASLFRNPAPSQPTHAGNDPFLGQLILIMCLLANHIRPSMPQEMDVLFYAGLLFASQFRAEELHMWRGRSPEFVSTFKKLVHSVRAYQNSRDCPIQFLVRHGRHIAEWEKLASSVISTSSQDLEVAVASPEESICARRTEGEDNGDATAMVYPIPVEKCEENDVILAPA